VSRSCRFRRVSGPALFVALALSAWATTANADIWGPVPRRWQSSGSGVREEWQQRRILLGGGVALPTTFPAGWNAGAGWSAAYVRPLQEWLDVAMGAEFFTHGFDDSHLSASGAIVAPVSRANLGDVSFGIRAHRPQPGWRWFGAAELSLPNVSRPTVFYTDSDGAHEIKGTEIFGFDPGLVLAAGFERCVYSRPGGAVEARLVVAPGRTRPSEAFLVFRAAIAIPLPL